MAEKAPSPAAEKKPEPSAKATRAKPAGKPAGKEVDKDFRYIVRLVNTDIDGNKGAVIGLADIKGIGLRTAEVIARQAGIAPTVKLGSLPESKTDELEKLATTYASVAPFWMANRQNDWSSGEDLHLVGADVDLNRRDDINLMKMIRCYKGIRHEQGQKVRGQRTRSNGRTGLTLGVMRKREGAPPGAAPEEKGKGEETKEK